jgi:hypothetical protein
LLREGISSAQKALFDSANNFTARQREMEAKNKELSDKVTQAAGFVPKISTSMLFLIKEKRAMEGCINLKR